MHAYKAEPFEVIEGLSSIASPFVTVFAKAAGTYITRSMARKKATLCVCENVQANYSSSHKTYYCGKISHVGSKFTSHYDYDGNALNSASLVHYI